MNGEIDFKHMIMSTKGKKIEYILKIANMVAKENHMTLGELCEKTRERRVVTARQITHELCYVLILGVSLDLIGSIIGGKGHSTVIHGIKTVNDLKQTDTAYKLRYDKLHAKVSKLFETRIQELINTEKRFSDARILKYKRAASIRHKMPYILTNEIMY